ncbi:hypothetical protein HWV62_30449 [Athelia sp. TMB]|nr:hypothetical protein HWV62_30449 [Athelia sp. TMB]
MDAYIASNCPELSSLMARVNISDGDRDKIRTPVSSPQLAYQRRRVSENGSPSQAPISPTSSSEYGDSSFERTIANLTIEEMAQLNGEDIVEISTDEEAGEFADDLNTSTALNATPLADDEGDAPPSPTLLALEFSYDPVKRVRQVKYYESYDNASEGGSPQRVRVTRAEGTTQSQQLRNLASAKAIRGPPLGSSPPARSAASNASSSIFPGSQRRGSIPSARSGSGTRTSKTSAPISAAPQCSGAAFQSGGGPSSSTSTSYVTASGSSSPSLPPSPPRTPPPAVLQNRPIYRLGTRGTVEYVEGCLAASGRLLAAALGDARTRLIPDDLKPYVLRVSHANYKGYDTVVQAQAAYMIGYSLGLVQVLGDDGNVANADGSSDADGATADDSSDSGGSATNASSAPPSLAPAQPTEEEIYHALERASSTFLGQNWIAVFRGVRPGVYPSWNFVSPLVSGLSTSVYEKFQTRAEAEQRWRQARLAGQVMTLVPGISYVRQD